MEARFNLEPTHKKKRRDVFDINICVFCSKPFSCKNPASIPDLSKFKSLFRACQKRQDNNGSKLLASQSDLSPGIVQIRCHKNCCSTYRSKVHIKRLEDRWCEPGSSGSANSDSASAEIGPFDWKTSCFICGEKCNPKNRYSWSLVEVVMDKAQGSQAIYTRVMKAAEQRKDHEMLTRLYGVALGDLVAVEARYHRHKGCYSHYISEKHISAQQRAATRTNAYKKTICKLIEEFRSAGVQEKQVFTLTMLKAQFEKIAKRTGIENPEIYSSSRLKKHIVEECPDMSCISQPGMSDLICSSHISMGDALLKIDTLTKALKDVSDESIIEAEIPESSYLPTPYKSRINSGHICGKYKLRF